jgi:hypothetical protein
VAFNGMTTNGKVLQNRCIVLERQSVVINLIRLHQIDDHTDTAIQKAMQLLLHFFFIAVSRIITRHEFPRRNPIGTRERN